MQEQLGQRLRPGRLLLDLLLRQVVLQGALDVGGVQLLEFDASGPVAEVSASVECADQVYTGTIEALAAGTTVTVGFDPALPGVDYCMVTLSGEVAGSFAVRTLFGDVNGDGLVSYLDYEAIGCDFRDPVDATNCTSDLTCDEWINMTDYLRTKLSLGWEVPPGP